MKKMCHDGLMGGFCLQPTDFYVCECLFDEIVKIKLSQLRCHEEIVISLTNQSRHLYSVSLTFLRERVVLCRSCAGPFMIIGDGIKICSHLKVELNIDEKIKVSCYVKCLRIALSRHIYILPHIAM